MIRVATCAFAGSYDVTEVLDRHLSGVAEAAAAGAALVVFPEISLQGYPPPLARGDAVTGLRSVYEVAERLDGHSVARITDAARNHGIRVIFGMTERSSQPGIVFNSAVLTGPDGIQGVYRKVHVGNGERMIWSAGDQWPVFETPFGRIGMLICYDQSWPEACRELVLRGADLLVMPTAWSIRPDERSPESSMEVQHYLLYGRARAIENARWFISSNFTGELGGRTFFGHSQVIDPLGRIVADTGLAPDPGFAIADIDVRSGIEEAYAWGNGPWLWRDRRPDTYTAIGSTRPRVSPSTEATPPSFDATTPRRSSGTASKRFARPAGANS